MSNNSKVYLLTLILTIIFTTSLSPLVNSGVECFLVRYHWRNFTRGTIAGNYIRAILQHSNGDIWFATTLGLSQFNGLWRTYTELDLRNAIGLAEADDGALWVATSNGVFRAQINNRAPFNVEEWHTYNRSSGLEADEILAIAKGDDGNIWVGTTAGAFLFDGRNWTARQDGLLANRVTAIYADSSQRLWVGIQKMDGQTAVCRFDGNNWEVFTQLDGLPSGYIRAIAEDRTQNIWIATTNGVGRFDEKGWDTFTSADGLADDDVQAIMIANNGVIWVGTSNGVSVVRETEVFDQGRWRKLTESDGLVNDNIKAICEDKNGGMWLGTNGRGVNFTDRMWQTFATESGLPEDLITAIGEDGEGNILVGTPNGLFKYDQNAVYECWDIITAGLPESSIRAITPARRGEAGFSREGELWIGTDKGLFNYDGIGTKLGGLGNDSVHAVEVDMAGNVWVGVGIFRGPAIDFSGALYKFDGAQWQDYRTDATVSSLLFDSRGRLWVGTFRDGIRVLIGEELQSFTEVDGLASNAISKIIEDADGNIWIGTANGISVSPPSPPLVKGGIGEFINITTDQGLIDNNVQSLFMAGDGSIWAGTSDGVSVFSKMGDFSTAEGIIASFDGEVHWVTVNDGLASNDIGVIFESSDGSIWFGSNDSSGLTRREIERVAPRTRITYGPVGTIGVNNVRFEFEGWDASTPAEGLSYFYTLKGSIDDVRPGSTSQKHVDFPGLEDKADYTFTVQAIDMAGNVDQIGDSASFHVDAAEPEARIDTPHPNQVVGGEVIIEGTATDDTDFLEYEIKAGPRFSHRSDRPVEDGVLARWYTRGEVKDGIYSIKLTVRDSINGDFDHQHVNNPPPVSVVVDNTKPQVQIMQPQTGETVSGLITIVGTIEEEHPHSYTIEYSPDLSEWQKTAAEFSTEKNITYQWDSSRVYGQTFLRLTTVDEAGNHGESEPIILTLDNDSALPRVEISGLNEEQVVTGIVIIRGTATSDKPFKKFKLEYKSQTSDWIMIREGEHRLENDIIAPWDTTKPKLADGIYELKLTAWDEDYEKESPPHKVMVDNSPPTASIRYPQNGSIISSSLDMEIRGDAFDTPAENFEEYILEYAKKGAGEEWETLHKSNEPKHDERLGGWNTLGRSGLYLLKLTVQDKAGLKNLSDTIEISLDDNPPTALISEPLNGVIVSGGVEISGTAKDDNSISGYRVSIKPEGADEWREIAYEPTPSKPKEKSMLIVWDTKGKNGGYVIKLEVWDETGHSTGEASPLRTVMVDNKAPIGVITAPFEYQQISHEVRLMGTAYDDNFKEYTVEYGASVKPEKWDAISATPFRQSVQDNLLAVWPIPAGKTGEHTLRLIVSDRAGHQSEPAKVTVVIKPIIPSSTGGKASDNDRKATIIIPPNSLDKDTAITVNPVLSANVLNGLDYVKHQSNPFNPSLSLLASLGGLPKNVNHNGSPQRGDATATSVDSAYDFSPPIHLNPIKPATIIISYSDDIRAGETLALFFWNGNAYQNKGGTVDKKQKTVAAPVTELGRYALMRVKSALPKNASISLLTCQPRVFSPERREATRISFTLNQPSKVTIKIYNVAGKLKRILQDDSIINKGGNYFPWDGRDENGKIVPGDTYIVTVTTEESFAQKTVIVWNN